MREEAEAAGRAWVIVGLLIIAIGEWLGLNHILVMLSGGLAISNGLGKLFPDLWK